VRRTSALTTDKNSIGLIGLRTHSSAPSSNSRALSPTSSPSVITTRGASDNLRILLTRSCEGRSGREEAAIISWGESASRVFRAFSPSASEMTSPSG